MAKKDKSHKKGKKTSTGASRREMKRRAIEAKRNAAHSTAGTTSTGLGRAATGSQHYCTHPQRAARRAAAVARKRISDGKSPEERLKLLDDFLGVGQGAAKERLRLQKQIAATKSHS